MMAYDIEKTNTHIILTPEPVTVYTNKTTGVRYKNDKTENKIKIRHNKPNAKYKQFTLLALDQIIIPITENITDTTGISFVFKTRKNATETITLDGGVNEFIEKLEPLLNPCYTYLGYDYFKLFINTVLIDIYSNREILDNIINGITPTNYLYFNNTKIFFEVEEVYHNKLEITLYDENDDPVDVNFWSIEDNNIRLPNNDTIGISVEVYPVTYGEEYEISNDPVNVKEIGSYKFKENKITLFFQENTLRAEQNKQAVIITIAHTGDRAGEGKIKLVRVLWYTLKKIILANVPMGNDWTLNIPAVVGNMGEEVTLSGEVTDPDGTLHNGNIQFYIL